MCEKTTSNEYISIEKNPNSQRKYVELCENPGSS